MNATTHRGITITPANTRATLATDEELQRRVTEYRESGYLLPSTDRLAVRAREARRELKARAARA